MKIEIGDLLCVIDPFGQSITKIHVILFALCNVTMLYVIRQVFRL